MKKKIIAIVAAVLLLGVSSAAYAAPAANCLQYANAQNCALGIPNSLCGTLQNCGNAAGLNLVYGLNGSSGSANTSCRLPAILDQAANRASNSACNNAPGANSGACNSAKSVCNNAAGANNGACDNGSACLNGSACGTNGACLNGGVCANNGACVNGNVCGSNAGIKSAVEAIRKQASGGNIVIDANTAANCNSAKISTVLSDLLKKLAENGCRSTATPTATAKPTATPVVTTVPTAKPVETPAVTATPVATEKPAETPAATAAPTEKPTLPSGADNLSFEEKVVELVNEQRALNGLSPLKLSSKLSDVARLKSQDMHDNKYFSHTSPTYGSPFDMMKTFGISYRSAGENIAMGYSSPESVMDGWMNSPGHRANILNASYTTIGVGYVADGHYWTQEFIG